MMNIPPIWLKIVDQSLVDGIYYGYLTRGEDKVGFSAWKGIPGGTPNSLYVFFVKDAPKNEAFLKEAKSTLWNWVKYIGIKEYFPGGVKIYGG